MLNNFLKIILVFFLYNALPIYAMKKDYECNQPSYNPQANAELLQIINTMYERPHIEKDWQNIIKYLERGANPNLKGIDDITILHLASSKNSKKYFNYFLEYGADANSCDDTGYSPLHALLAELIHNSQNFDSEMLETLLKYNASPNLPVIENIPNTQENYSFLPLDSAITRDNENSVKILLKYGANINAKSSYIRSQPFFHCSITPVARAIMNNKLGILGVLCREYASLEDVSNFHGGTAFEFALKTLKNPEPTIKTLIINARFKLPTTEKKLDSIALELLLILKHQFKFQIPEELKFRILSILPAIQNFKEPDSTLYQKLFHKNYKNPYLFARLEHHMENIIQIVNKKDKSGRNAFFLLMQDEKTKKIIPQLMADIAILLQSNNQNILPNNLALQICNNYEELLKEKQEQSIKY